MADGDIDINAETAALVTALAKFEPETAKILKSELGKFGTKAKNVVAQNTPSRSGFARSRWGKKTMIGKNKVTAAVTISWPSGVPRYPFMLEHGRPAGVSPKTGRSVTYMAPRKYLARSRAGLAPEVEELLQRIHDEAVEAFGQ